MHYWRWAVVLTILSLCLGSVISTVFAFLRTENEELPTTQSSKKVSDSSYATKEYSSIEEQDRRADRFPSVQDRVKLYMGSWYTPPCQGNEELLIPYSFMNNTAHEERLLVLRELAGSDDPNRRTLFLENKYKTGATSFNLDEENMLACRNYYCRDVIRTLLPAFKRIKSEKQDSNFPVIFQFGDSWTTYVPISPDLVLFDEDPNIPVIKKFRTSYNGYDTIHELTRETCIKKGPRPIPTSEQAVLNNEAIIWKLTTQRHFERLPFIAKDDIPWEEKMNLAVFRGALTGRKRDIRNDHGRDLLPKFKLKNVLDDKERCLLMHRCRLVYHNANSSLVDARLVEPLKNIPKRIGDIDMYGAKYHHSKLLQYKAIIMLEGNDVSSGFKWAMYSNSVVMTQKPTKTSWAMEELLEPWVHYIPLNQNLTDVDEKMQWVIDNEEQAREIARRGSLWMKDMLFHPDAKKDEELIYEEMLKRYRVHFVHAGDLSLE